MADINYYLMVYLTQKKFQATSDYLKGELIYSNEGFLSVQIFFKDEIIGPRDLLTYSGKYKVISDSVIEHHIEICSNSRKDNTIDNRNYRIQEDIIFLTIKYEDETEFEAKWKKF